MKCLRHRRPIVLQTLVLLLACAPPIASARDKDEPRYVFKKDYWGSTPLVGNTECIFKNGNYYFNLLPFQEAFPLLQIPANANGTYFNSDEDPLEIDSYFLFGWC